MIKATNPNIKYWLAMLRIPGVGNQTMLRLLDHFDFGQVFTVSRTNLHALGFSKKIIAALQTPDWELVERDLEWLSQPENHAVNP